MQHSQTNEALLQHFQVEELEERLENKWTCYCPVESTDPYSGSPTTDYVECPC
ncbi:hypothetical protein [Emticicia sp.]|uniref:hypothetical protein n=1 Tax=Emticicia sp. TaxID=1930953 RepID=UPI003750216D